MEFKLTLCLLTTEKVQKFKSGAASLAHKHSTPAAKRRATERLSGIQFPSPWSLSHCVSRTEPCYTWQSNTSSYHIFLHKGIQNIQACPPNPITSKGNIHGIRPPDYETSWDYHPVPFLTSLTLQINSSVYIFLFTLAAVGMLLCVCIAKKSHIFGLQRKRSQDIAMTPRDMGRKLAGFGGRTKTSWDGQSLSVSFTFSAVQGVLTHSVFTYSREEKVGAL